MANPIILPARLNASSHAPVAGPSASGPIAAPRFNIDTNISFEDRGKIPQIVRDLPDFNGNPRDLSQWMLDVEDVLELFDDLKDSFQYHLLIKTIRRKIKGEANDALITSNTPTKWENIKEVLKLYYADKRDLMTLDNQLKSLVRTKQESIESYYSRVRELVTLISSAISMDDQWKGHELVLMRLYNQIALDTFIRGLGDPLSRFCKNFRPQSLAQAYSYCVDYLNLDARNAPVNIPAWHPIPTAAPRQLIAPPRPNPIARPPVPPPRQFFAPNNFTRPPPIPQPRNFKTDNGPNVFAPNRTFVQPQPRPEPMDTSTLRTQQIDYGNRPTGQRRGQSDSMRAHGPDAKRFAHALEEIFSSEEYEKWYDQQYEQTKEPINIDECLETLGSIKIEDKEDEPIELAAHQAEDGGKEEDPFLEAEWVSKWFG